MLHDSALYTFTIDIDIDFGVVRQRWRWGSRQICTLRLCVTYRRRHCFSTTGQTINSIQTLQHFKKS